MSRFTLFDGTFDKFLLLFHSHKKQVIDLVSTIEWSKFIGNHQKLAKEVTSVMSENL
jgi:hypothetical protein